MTLALPASLRPVVFGRQRQFCCHMARLSGTFPPNSLAAVAECVAAGVPRLEIDLRFLADDAMLIFHDSVLDRETDGSGPVSELSSDEARRLRHREGGPLSFLDEVVDVMRGSATTLQVDLKLMQPISSARVDRLVETLAPVREHTVVGSQAHWNLRAMDGSGLSLAFDPTMQWHASERTEARGRSPARRGKAGLWDDAPLGHIAGAPTGFYLRSRVADILGLLPCAIEWMVDIETIRKLGELGLPLGEHLASAGVSLAAWTIRAGGREETLPVLQELFALGVTTVIADDPLTLAGYSAARH